MTDRQPKTRHVWVLPAYAEAGRPWAGLVVSWRLRHTQTTGPTWEALVMVVDEKTDSARMEWISQQRLVPVRSEPPS